MFQKAKTYLRTNFELLFWASALVLLFFLPEKDNGFTLCPLHWLGFKYCPGCGIGRAIHYAMRLQWATSFHYHPMGVPGLFIIGYRIHQLLPKPKQHTYGSRRHNYDDTIH